MNPDQIASTLRTQLTPEQIGMTFVPVAEQAFAEVDVIFRLEIELARRAPAADFHVGRLVRADRHIVGRQIRQIGEQIAHFRFGFFAQLFELGLPLF